MYRIGIDVGSTYTKYCILDDTAIVSLFMEKTPIRQMEYFEEKIAFLNEQYQGARIVSCGYGKNNVPGVKNINELSALAKGCHYVMQKNAVILDIGGQDTKIITQFEGKLSNFFLNDKCAAGSGLFLSNTLDMLGLTFDDINQIVIVEPELRLSATCAVFAQSEIVELIADNKTEQEILSAVMWQIFTKAKPLLSKVEGGSIYLSGGLCQIASIDKFASLVLGRECHVILNGAYIASIGCAVFN